VDGDGPVELVEVTEESVGDTEESVVDTEVDMVVKVMITSESFKQN
jgi:hypothetical protein